MLTTFRFERGPQVIPAKFDYVAPTSVEEALAALAEHGDDAKVIAGGQSLLPVLRMRLNAPEVLVDIGGIDALKQVTDEGDSVLIGAMVPYYELLANEKVWPLYAPKLAMGRPGSGDEVSRAAVFLAGPDSAYVDRATGAILYWVVRSREA